MQTTNTTDTLPANLVTVRQSDGSEITGEYYYSTSDGWIGLRLPGEQRVDEYPSEFCSVWSSLR